MLSPTALLFTLPLSEGVGKYRRTCSLLTTTYTAAVHFPGGSRCGRLPPVTAAVVVSLSLSWRTACTFEVSKVTHGSAESRKGHMLLVKQPKAVKVYSLSAKESSRGLTSLSSASRGDWHEVPRVRRVTIVKPGRIHSTTQHGSSLLGATATKNNIKVEVTNQRRRE